MAIYVKLPAWKLDYGMVSLIVEEICFAKGRACEK
jgi:hypothetical protein